MWVSWPSRARPSATLAGEPPTCSSVWPSGVCTMSTSSSPMTTTGPAAGSLTRQPSGCGRPAVRSRSWWLSMSRMVPDLLRMTMELVVAPPAAVAHAVEEVAVADAGGDEEGVLARHEVVGGEDAVEVVPGVEGLLPLLVVLGPQPALDDPAHALDRARRDDALGSAADADEEVDAGRLAGGGDRARDVAVGDEADAGAGRADVGGQLLVARPVEHDDGDVLRPLLLDPGDAADVLADREADVDDVGDLGAGDELVHVEDRARVVHPPAVGDREHRDRARHPLGAQRRAVDRVDRDVDLRAGAVAHLLAVEEHRGVVLLALADDDGALHRDGGDQGAHRGDGGPVREVLLAPADPPAGGHRGRLGDPDELEREVAVGVEGRRALGHLVLRLP